MAKKVFPQGGDLVNITGIVTLGGAGDTFMEGYNAYNGGVNLNGRRLVIGAGGINVYHNYGVPKVYGGGNLTSSSPTLNFNFLNQSNLRNGYMIDAVISDYSVLTRTGLRVSGGVPGHESHIDLTGGVSNTFTGDVDISGNAGVLLYKKGGAIAIRGNIYLRENAYLSLYMSEQISDSSTITLDGRNGTPRVTFAHSVGAAIVERIHKLKVEGTAELWFTGHNGVYIGGSKTIYLDDLEIADYGKLIVKAWHLGAEFILVRKDSEHLHESLSRIKFEGAPADWHGALKDFNKDYWQIIPGLPEPATYGAILSAAILGLACYRKQKSAALSYAALAKN